MGQRRWDAEYRYDFRKDRERIREMLPKQVWVMESIFLNRSLVADVTVKYEYSERYYHAADVEVLFRDGSIFKPKDGWKWLEKNNMSGLDRSKQVRGEWQSVQEPKGLL